jgi:hypothetical protein
MFYYNPSVHSSTNTSENNLLLFLIFLCQTKYTFWKVAVSSAQFKGIYFSTSLLLPGNIAVTHNPPGAQQLPATQNHFLRLHTYYISKCLKQISWLPNITEFPPERSSVSHTQSWLMCLKIQFLSKSFVKEALEDTRLAYCSHIIVFLHAWTYAWTPSSVCMTQCSSIWQFVFSGTTHLRFTGIFTLRQVRLWCLRYDQSYVNSKIEPYISRVSFVHSVSSDRLVKLSSKQSIMVTFIVNITIIIVIFMWLRSDSIKLKR